MIKTQAPRSVTLIVALVLWLLGAAEMLAGVALPSPIVGSWCLLIAGGLLLLGCTVKGL
jgi:hypothetical protein